MIELLEYYKDLYEKEIEFSERLNSKIGNSLAILTVIGSGHVLLATEVFPIQLPASIWSIMFLVLFCISAFFLAKAIYRFKGAYSGFTYSYFPIAGMDKAIEASLAYGESHNKQYIAEAHIDQLLIERYKNDAIINRQVNLKKNQMHYMLSSSLITSFSMLVITFMCWVILFKI